MRAGLVPLQDELGFRLEEVDVDADPELARIYGHRVPVLVRDGVEICHYFLDTDALRLGLSQA
ncbi:MAG: glutaredoxin family protein [Thiobacillaceae bacterium]|jgi:hypothetical protein|nr:glutaredoxin family protein [Thiobacillaceae bacterium]